MRSRPLRIAAAVLGGAIVLGLWAFFAPTKLGGSTTFSVTSGISMEPLLHKNDLAFVRTQGTYKVGDVVLYQSKVVNQPVLHRIILIQHGKYYFQGDNNNFVDPGYARRSQLVGTLWFSLPAVGSVLGWFGKPAHGALVAGLATLLIVVTFSTATTGRRSRRRGPKNMPPKDRQPRPTVAPSPDATASATAQPPARDVGAAAAGRSPHRDPNRRRPPPYLEGPASTLIALGVTLALALLLSAIGFSQPLMRIGTHPDAFRQTGTFSYSAAANVTTPVYPSGLVTTGDPIYPSLVDVVTLNFGYRFTSSLPHDIKGTVELRALVLSQTDTWQEVATVVPVTDFVGNKTSVSADLPLASLYTHIESVSADSGVAGTNYSVDIQPVVHVTGTVNHRRIDEKFSPVLPFAVSTAAIRVDVAVAPPPPGATFEPVSAGSALDAALSPSQSGSIPELVANVLHIAKYDVPISTLRTLGIVFAVLALALALVHDRRRRRGTRRSHEEQIAKGLHALIVPVATLGPAQGRTAIAVPEFADLAGLARFLERPILYEVRDQKRTYAVDDESLRYFTAARDRRRAPGPGAESTGGESAGGESTDDDGTTPPTDATPKEAREHTQRVADAVPTRRRRKSALVARFAAGLILLAVIATVTVTFTASNTVPASRVGRSVQPGAVNQARPAGCSSLSLDSLVHGSGTFSTSDSNALILGSAGVDTISATGQKNCIVAGGGKDKVTSTSGSVCVISPTSGATYTNCTKVAR